MKLYYVAEKGEIPVLLSFLYALEDKQRQKILRQFALLLTSPMPREPIVKHFSLERYSKLLELRAKSRILIRIIFTIREDGSILFLMPFIKKEKRDTMTALNAALKLLAQIEDGTCEVNELGPNMLLEINAYDKNAG